MTGSRGNILALCGGVGGAKLALGLVQALPPARLGIVVKTGDDFAHLDLTICPDLDTVIYTLAGEAHPATGWGRADETWDFMQSLAEKGGPTWFRLGDKDLTLHVHRQDLLDQGRSLSEVTADIARRFHVDVPVYPMTDDPVRTVVETADGPLTFQHYFVRDRCAPQVTGVRFDGAPEAQPSPGFAAALADWELGAVVICPSNPFVSIDPILAVGDVQARLGALEVPVIAVSPLVGGEAIKGPTAKMMDELGLPRTVEGIADHYGDLIDGLVIDTADAASADGLRARGLKVHVCNTVMRTREDRIALAEACLRFAKVAI